MTIETIAETWLDSGYLHLPQFFSSDQRQIILQAAHDIIEWPETPGKWMRYYETTPSDKQLCRIENFLDYHTGLKQLVLQPTILDMLEELMGEPPILFKEKINFKLPGGKGFTPHQDAPAWTSFNQDYHITALIPLDPFTTETGGLEVVREANKSTLPMADDNTIHPDTVAQLHWEALDFNIGDLFLFDSYLPHRSGTNRSQHSRRGIFLTFNRQSAGNHRADYYQLKRDTFPPECERVAGKRYEGGVFNLGNPIN